MIDVTGGTDENVFARRRIGHDFRIRVFPTRAVVPPEVLSKRIPISTIACSMIDGHASIASRENVRRHVRSFIHFWVTEIMELTPSQIKVMKIYQQWQQKPPTCTSILISVFWRYAILAAGCTLYAIAFQAIGFPEGGLFVLGLCFGCLIQFSMQARYTAKVWPAVDRVLDWNQVDRAATGQIPD